MKYSKFFQYAYLVFAALFLYDAFAKWSNTGEIAYGSLILGILAVFMFFFKRRFSKKFQDRGNSK